jgi:hypothetical protein
MSSSLVTRSNRDKGLLSLAGGKGTSSSWGIKATGPETAVRIQRVVSIKARASVKPVALGHERHMLSAGG